MDRGDEKWLVSILLILVILAGASFFRFTGNDILNGQSMPGNETNACQELNVSGVYSLSSDILNENVGSNCFNVSVSDIELDCAGHSIINNSLSQPAVYAANVINFTLKNCNISVGNQTSAANAVYFVNVNNSIVINNNLSSNYDALFLNQSNYILVVNNWFNSNAAGAVKSYLGASNNFTSNNFAGNGIFGIFIANSDSNILSNNLFNSNALSSDGGSIYVLYSNLGKVINNTINFSIGSGIFLGSSNNTLLANNSIFSNENSSIYIYSGINNTLQNNALWNFTGDASDAPSSLSLLNTNGSTISGGSINLSMKNLINAAGSGNIVIKDLQLAGATLNDTLLTGGSNCTFTNVSYNLSKEYITEGSMLTRKWYYRVLVNDSQGHLVNGASVIISNTSGTIASVLTGSNGLISVQELVSYYSNGTWAYKGVYTVNASNATKSATHNVNVSTNILNDSLTFNVTISTGSLNTTSDSGDSEDSEDDSSNSTSNQTSGTQNSGQTLTIYSATSEQIEGGYRQTISTGESILFNIDEESHSLKIDQILINSSNENESSVVFLISSDPIQVNLSYGKQEKVDINADKYFDILLGFEGVIDDNEVEVYLMRINETIVKEAQTQAVTNVSPSTVTPEKKNILSAIMDKVKMPVIGGIKLYYLIIGIAVIVLVFAGYLFVLKKRKAKRSTGDGKKVNVKHLRGKLKAKKKK